MSYSETENNVLKSISKVVSIARLCEFYYAHKIWVSFSDKMFQPVFKVFKLRM